MCAHSGNPTLRVRGASHCLEGLLTRMQIAARERRRAATSVTPAFVEQASRAQFATCQHRAREWRAARVARATCARSLRAQRGKRERAQWRSLLRATTRTTLTRTRARGMKMRSRPAHCHKARAVFLRRVFFRFQLAGRAVMRVSPQPSHVTAEHCRVLRLRHVSERV